MFQVSYGTRITETFPRRCLFIRGYARLATEKPWSIKTPLAGRSAVIPRTQFPRVISRGYGKPGGGGGGFPGMMNMGPQYQKGDALKEHVRISQHNSPQNSHIWVTER
jgi:hypothetical protein